MPECADMISLCELEMPDVLTPVQPGWSFRPTVPVDEVIVFHMRAGPGCLWEQQFGRRD